MRVFAGVFVSAMLLCGAAQAASFDCARAGTPDERAVCDNPALSRLDDRLGAAYDAARTTASGAGQTEVRRIARDFLAIRSECRRDVPCIRDAYGDVLEALDAAGEDETADADETYFEEADTPPDHASPSVCVVILGLQRQAIEAGRASGDDALLGEASRSFRATALDLYEGDEIRTRQMIGSTVAFYDRLTPAQLSSAADLCLAAVDDVFTQDE